MTEHDEDEAFEDWSHPTTGRLYTLPRRRPPLRFAWGWIALIVVTWGLVWFVWHLAHVVADAYRVVFGG